MAASGSGFGGGPVSHEDIDEERSVRERITNPIGDEKLLKALLNNEEKFDQTPLPVWVSAARMKAVEWIIKTRALFNLKFVTAFLSVSYLDRYLSKKQLIEGRSVVQLLSMACLTVAADRVEPEKADVFRIDFGDIWFPSYRIRHMGNDVKCTLNYCDMESMITPFDFIRIFVPKCCKERPNNDVVIATEEAIFTTIRDRRFMGYLPSVIAIAATLFATDPTLTRQSLQIRMYEIALEYFDIGDVYACYERIRQLHLRLATARANLLPFPRARL